MNTSEIKKTGDLPFLPHLRKDGENGPVYIVVPAAAVHASGISGECLIEMERLDLLRLAEESLAFYTATRPRMDGEE